MTKRGYMASFVFSTGSGAPQTADTYDLDKDTYLEVTAEKDAAGHYLVKNVTSEIVPSGIESVEADNILSDGWYDLQGRRLNDMPTQKGVYINGGKKVVVR